MSRWTGADEADYRLVLDELLVIRGHDLDRLRRKIVRQDEAIVALRRKYGSTRIVATRMSSAGAFPRVREWMGNP